MNHDDLKYYYSITEVSNMFNLNESTLRFWEKEFKELNPKRAGRGIRKYSKEDLKVVEKIVELTKNKGHKLKAAQKELKKNKQNNNEKVIEELEKLKSKLLLLLNQVN